MHGVRMRLRLETIRCSWLPNTALANCEIAELSYSASSKFNSLGLFEQEEEYSRAAFIYIFWLLLELLLLHNFFIFFHNDSLFVSLTFLSRSL